MKTTRQLQGLLDNNIKPKRLLIDRDLFEYYDNPYDIDLKTFQKILESFDLFVIKYLFEAYVVELSPIGKMGILSTKRVKKTSRFNFVLWKETGEKKLLPIDHHSPVTTLPRWFHGGNSHLNQLSNFRFSRLLREAVEKHVKTVPVGTYYPVT